MEGGFSLDKFMPSLAPEDAEALGKMLDDMEAEKAARRKAADDAAGALDLLSRVRFALGDNGTRMQDELLVYCRELAAVALRFDELQRHAAALAEALDGYQESCGEGHPRPKFDCLTCGEEEQVLSAYRDFMKA